MEEFAERLGVMARWAVWPIAYAVAVGVSAWALSRDQATFVRFVDNRIS
jgi:hypothetical protein